MQFPPPPPPPPKASPNYPSNFSCPNEQTSHARFGQGYQERGQRGRGARGRGPRGGFIGNVNGYGQRSERTRSFYQNQNQIISVNPQGYGGHFSPYQSQTPQVAAPSNTQPVHQNGYNAQTPSNPIRGASNLYKQSVPRQSFSNPQGNERKPGHCDTVGRGRRPVSKGQAPPAVPSFGGPIVLPTKPSATQAETLGKGRSQNLLGLTPNVDDEDSENDAGADEDEELKLAALSAGNGVSQQLQVCYKGQTSTLQSSSDIAAWLAERRKRFPTKARIVEAAARKKELDEKRQAAKASSRQQQNKPTRGAKSQNVSREQAHKAKEVDRPDKVKKDAAAESRQKIEWLRRQLEEEEKRAAKLDLQKTSAQKGDRQGAPEKHALEEELAKGPSKKQKQDHVPDERQTGTGEIDNAQTTNDIHTSTEPHNKDAPIPSQVDKASNAAPHDDNKARASHDSLFSIPSSDSASLSLSDLEEEDETTSSSGSSSASDSDSDLASNDICIDEDQDEDAPPEETATSKTPVPSLDDHPRDTKNENDDKSKPRAVCQFFSKTGRCKWGARCRYRHERPERERRGKKKEERRGGADEAGKGKGEGGRKTLFQRLVDQEREKEDQMVLDAIMFLGDRGMLDPADAATKKTQVE